MKLIKENKYKGNITRKIIKGTISLGIVGGIFFSGINADHTVTIPEPYGYTIMSNKEKIDFVIFNIENEKILPKNTSDVIEDKLLDEFIEKTTNNDIKDADCKVFRDYILKNYLENNDSIQNLIKKTNSSNKIKFDKNDLTYTATVDFEEKKTSGYFFIEQSVSNKEIEFSSINFINKRLEDCYSYYSYEIILKKYKKDGVKSILLENNNNSNDVTLNITLHNEKQFNHTIKEEDALTFKNNLLNNFDKEYNKSDFEEQNKEMLLEFLEEDYYKIYPNNKKLIK